MDWLVGLAGQNLLDYGLAAVIAVGLGRELRMLRQEFTQFKTGVLEATDALKDNLAHMNTRVSVVEAVLAQALRDDAADEAAADTIIIEIDGSKPGQN